MSISISPYDQECNLPNNGETTLALTLPSKEIKNTQKEI